MVDTTTITVKPTAPAVAVPPWWMAFFQFVIVEMLFGFGLVLAYRLADQTLFNIALAFAIAQGTTVINYFFGSSKSSADKDAVAAKSGDVKDATIAATSAALATSIPAVTLGTVTTTTTTSDKIPPVEPTGTTTVTSDKPLIVEPPLTITTPVTKPL